MLGNQSRLYTCCSLTKMPHCAQSENEFVEKKNPFFNV